MPFCFFFLIYIILHVGEKMWKWVFLKQFSFCPLLPSFHHPRKMILKMISHAWWEPNVTSFLFQNVIKPTSEHSTKEPSIKFDNVEKKGAFSARENGNKFWTDACLLKIYIFNMFIFKTMRGSFHVGFQLKVLQSQIAETKSAVFFIVMFRVFRISRDANKQKKVQSVLLMFQKFSLVIWIHHWWVL
jgi:hypothetical protein